VSSAAVTLGDHGLV
jgi:hypothetical protein